MSDPGTAAWIEALLRARLGPGAALGALTFTGRFLHLDGAHLPLGAGAALHVSHLVVELGAGLPLGELPLAARLVALRSELRAAGTAVPLDFTATEGGEPAWAHGTLRLAGVEVTLTADPSGWNLTGDRLRAQGGVIPPSFAGLALDRFPLAVAPALPADLVLSGTVSPRDDGALAADLVLATARSRLSITGTLSASRHLDALLGGRIALADMRGFVPAVPEALVDLDLTAAGPLADPTLTGRLFAPELRASRPGAPPGLVERLGVVIDADRRRLRYRDLVGHARGARFGGWGTLPFAPSAGEAAAVPLAALQIEHAGAALLAEVAAASGLSLSLARPGAPGIPPDLEVTGELMVSASRALSGSFALETPRSALLFRLVVGADGALLGSTLRGRFSGADAATVGLAGGPLRPAPGDIVTLDARLSGTLGRPGLTGRLGAASLSLDASAAILTIAGASVLLDVGPDGLAWQDLSGRLYGGRFTSTGRLARGSGALDATLAFEGVRLEELLTSPSGDRALSTLIHGACSGEARFERQSTAANALTARARLTVTDPRYLFLRPVSPALARYGLPPVSARGAGPLVASARLERGEIVVEPISAALDGLDVEGSLRVEATHGGELQARARVHLLDRYLARSPLLAIPAAFTGRITIPVYARGRPGALKVETDVREIVAGLVAGSRVGEAVRSALDGLWGAARASRKRR